MALRSPANAQAPFIGNGATVTVSTPLLNLTQTWNAGGVTFTGALVNVTDTASAAGSAPLDIQVGGTSWFTVGKLGAGSYGFSTPSNNSNGVTINPSRLAMGPNTTFGWSSTGVTASTQGTADVVLARDAANTLALRNGVNAQAQRWYGTYTDSSNGEWAELTWSSNIAYLQPKANGTGTTRQVILVSGSTTVASLPAASAALTGARAFVTDANASTFGTTAASGGANKVPVVCDGSAWKIG